MISAALSDNFALRTATILVSNPINKHDMVFSGRSAYASSRGALFNDCW